MSNIPTVTIQLTQAELQLMVDSLNYLTSINLPIEAEFLKPYVWLQDDLKKAQTFVEDGIRNKENETTDSEAFNEQVKCKECD